MNDRIHYKNNKSYYINKAQLVKEAMRKWLKQYKVEKGCKYCPEKLPPRCLHFHHRDPKTKEFNISQSVKVSWGKLKREVEKCDVVCANCHAKLHDAPGV